MFITRKYNGIGRGNSNAGFEYVGKSTTLDGELDMMLYLRRGMKLILVGCKREGVGLHQQSFKCRAVFSG